jgi:hypothetical protein
MVRRFLPVVLVLVCMPALLAACGATGEATMGGAPQAAMPTTAVEVETEADAESAAAGDELAQAAGSAVLDAGARSAEQRMILKNAEMELLVADTDVALDEVTRLADDYGGYIISSHTWMEDSFGHANVRMGVPAQEFENVMRRLRALALVVTSEVASGEDVTDQYVDLQSRLTNLQATRDRIREFLDKAATVEEALKVNEQLSQVEGQIEEIQGRMNYLKDRAAYSTIDVILNPEMPTPTPTPTPTPQAWRPGQTFHSAFDTLTVLVRGLGDVLIWVTVVFGPLILVAALAVGLILWARRRHRKPKAPPPAGPSESAG